MVHISGKSLTAAEAKALFGQSRAQVIKTLGEPEECRVSSTQQVDFYSTFKVLYSPTLICDGVEFCESLVIDGVDLLTLSWGETMRWFLARDPSVQPGDILESKKLRMMASTWSSSHPEEDQPTETVMLVSKDYHWMSEDEIEAGIRQLDAEMAQLPAFELPEFDESIFG
jgi:hypothetical protein